MSIPPYHLECHDLCSLKEGTKWGKKASDLLASGTSYRKTIEVAAAEGVRLNMATLSRHRKHIVVTGPSAEAESVVPGGKASNIEILESIIQRGFANQKNWKPTISDTMKALDMHFRLTQGNPFDELLDTLAAAAIGAPSDEIPAAIGTPEETEAFEEEE